MSDMTKGKIFPLLLRFAVPVFFGNVVQQVYGLVDSIIVGRYLGGEALAAIGATDSLTYLILGCTNGIAGGFAVCTAQMLGSGEKEKLKLYAAHILKYCFMISVSLAIVLLLGNQQILTGMKIPGQIQGMSLSYLNVIFGGLPISMGLNALLSVLRSIGNSRISFYLLTISSCFNIGLDILFVNTFQLGVTGAAQATILSQFIVLFIGVIYSRKNYPELCFGKKEMKRNSECLRNLMKNGLPMGFQVFITAVATMIVQVALNRCGTECITAFTIGTKIQNVLNQTYNAIGMTVATFVGQNYGNKDYERIRKGLVVSCKMGLVCALICILGVSTCLDVGIRLFGEDVTEEVSRLCHYFMNCCMLGYIPLSLLFVFRSALQGMGYAGITLLGGLSELVARAFVVMVLATAFGYRGICFGHTAAWTFALLCLLPMYLHKTKKWRITK